MSILRRRLENVLITLLTAYFEVCIHPWVQLIWLCYSRFCTQCKSFGVFKMSKASILCVHILKKNILLHRLSKMMDPKARQSCLKLALGVMWQAKCGPFAKKNFFRGQEKGHGAFCKPNVTFFKQFKMLRWTKIVMQRNFGQNSGFKPVSAKTRIRECFDWNCLNFGRIYFATAERLPSRVRKNWEAESCFSNQNNCLILRKWSKNIGMLAIFCRKRWETFRWM